MKPPVQDLISYLEDNSSMVLGVDLFGNTMPERSGTTVCLIDHSGTEPDPNLIYNPSVQVLVRANRGYYLAAYAKMQEVLNLLHGLANINIDGTNYIIVWQQGDIMSIGEDKKGRPILSCNLRIKRTESI